MYFADPYCAWQKRTNENLNGLLREFYPKGRNLERVSKKTLKKNLALINARHPPCTAKAVTCLENEDVALSLTIHL